MAEVLIISGAGDYSDPWHRFGDTSLRLAEIIAGLGHQVTISDAVEKALADPGKPGLIVINIGHPVRGRTMHPKQDLFTVVVHDGAHHGDV